jgi:hypothetical protein
MTKLTIVVSGMISAVPLQGGAAWAVLQYLLGFKRLGHDVYFVEPIGRAELVPPHVALAESANARYFRDVMAEFEFEQASALLQVDTRETVGLDYEQLRQISRRADLLVNISGLLSDEALLEAIPVRVYLDLDPAFTQLWQFTQGINVRVADHTHFATVGLAVGQPGCDVPTGGLTWIPTLPPVVLEHWPAGTRITFDALTTVANWRGYGSIEHDGIHYGQKAHSLRKLIEIPCQSTARCVLALAIHPDERADLERLERARWELVDPLAVAATPAAYRGFVRSSWAELGVAKDGYVTSRCGWFSDRSVCYLASGRPVIAQDTGFSSWLATGEGLLAFNTTAEAVAAIELVRSDYARHARAARALAETSFNSDNVLATLLNHVGVSA